MVWVNLFAGSVSKFDPSGNSSKKLNTHEDNKLSDFDDLVISDQTSGIKRAKDDTYTNVKPQTKSWKEIWVIWSNLLLFYPLRSFWEFILYFTI